MEVRAKFLYVVIAMTTMCMGVGVAAEDAGVFVQSNYVMIPSSNNSLKSFVGNAENWKILPDHVWAVLNRPVLVAQIDKKAFVYREDPQEYAALFYNFPDLSLESIIRLDVRSEDGAIKRYGSPLELTPVPTIAMKEWAKRVPKTWLMPLPKGVIDTTNGNNKAIINPIPQEAVPRIEVGRDSIFNNRLLGETIRAFDQPLSVDDAIAFAFRNGAFYPIETENGIVFRQKRHVKADRRIHLYYYASGRYGIDLEVMTEREDEVLKWYTTAYPPTVPKGYSIDYTAIALKRLDTMILLMEQSINDPVPYLRSAARAYPFDEALFKACQTLPPQTLITSYDTYRKEREEIHRFWADAQVAETVDVKSYQDRVRSHRETWIGNMKAARTRIAVSGLAPTKPTFRLWYTDSPPPRYGDEDVE